MEEKKHKILSGIFVFFVLITLSALVLIFGQVDKTWRPAYSFSLHLSDASGITKGSEIRLSGSVIGRVSQNPHLREDFEVEIPLEVYKSVSLPSDAKFTIKSLNFLGDKAVFVSVNPASSASLIMEGDIVSFEGVNLSAKTLSSDLPPVVLDLLEEIQDALFSIRLASHRIENSFVKVDEQILSDENIQNLTKTVERLPTILENIENFSKNLEKYGILRYRSQ